MTRKKSAIFGLAVVCLLLITSVFVKSEWMSLLLIISVFVSSVLTSRSLWNGSARQRVAKKTPKGEKIDHERVE